MSISENAIILVKNLLIPLKNAGAISANDFDEFMSATAIRNEKPLPPKTLALIRRQDCAKMLGISTRSFDRLLSEKLFHPIKIGKRSIRINKAEIDDFINKNSSKGGIL